MRELRIHHFFDIIRDYGSGKTVKKHPYGHSYHLVAKEVFENTLDRIKLVIKNDDICINCIKLQNNLCIDVIGHRDDFSGKQDFNDHLDRKIMSCMDYEDGRIISIEEIVMDSDKYLDSIYELYAGNDPEHTASRKKNVAMGIAKWRKEQTESLSSSEAATGID